MAALAFNLSRTAAAAAAPAPALRRAAFEIPALRQIWPGLSGLLGEWLLRAVPKKKVSHSRKSMRSANKGPSRKSNISLCDGCGQPKRTHHICLHCFRSVSRFFKLGAAGPQAKELRTTAQEEGLKTYKGRQEGATARCLAAKQPGEADALRKVSAQERLAQQPAEELEKRGQ